MASLALSKFIELTNSSVYRETEFDNHIKKYRPFIEYLKDINQLYYLEN